MASNPLPLRQFIVKVHNRCNLACDYCYVYESIDKRWLTRPATMSLAVADDVALRIAEHVREHRLPAVDVILHGGEPLLAGREKLAYLLSAVHSAAGSMTAIRFVLQTNALLLDQRYLELFHKWNVQIGISLDGNGIAHDRHRRSRKGSSTYQAVAEKVRGLAGGPFRPLYAGLLCTIDVRNDPTATYGSLLEFSPPVIDFLLPHGNWAHPPPLRDTHSSRTPYGDWLTAVFDRWYDAALQETRVRLFEAIIDLLLGGRSSVEGVGLDLPRMAVVETDGAIERADVLSTTYEAAAATGLNVSRDPFDAMLALPALYPRSPAPACQRCDLYRVCGGGLPAHRYKQANGFDNPSVYCPDLYRLIGHVRRRFASDMKALRTS